MLDRLHLEPNLPAGQMSFPHCRLEGVSFHLALLEACMIYLKYGRHFWVVG
jgi:hypothetical protein